MKKLHIILTSLLAIAIILISNPVIAQQGKTPDKKTETKTDKKEVKKVPAKKTDKKAKAK
jgi:hypothetical protein